MLTEKISGVTSRTEIGEREFIDRNDWVPDGVPFSWSRIHLLELDEMP